jgi:hypothetical protein
MSIGWLSNLTDGEIYFTSERLVTNYWDSLPDDDMKSSAILMAYNRLFYSTEFTLPDYASASVTQLVILRKANCEMAYYLLGHLEDEDIRKNLQAQGVVKAGIVKEDYSEDMLMEVPIPPWVYDLLKKGGWHSKTTFKIVEIERDMNKDLKK